MITKKTALNTHWTPTNWPQLVHWVSARISRETDTESLEQFGHFLFKDYAPQFLSTVRHGSVAVVQAHSSSMTGFGRLAYIQPGPMSGLADTGRSEGPELPNLNVSKWPKAADHP